MRPVFFIFLLKKVEEENINLSKIKGVLIGGQEQWHKKNERTSPSFHVHKHRKF